MSAESDFVFFSRFAWLLIAPLAVYLLRFLYRRLYPDLDHGDSESSPGNPLSRLFGNIVFATPTKFGSGRLSPPVIPVKLPTGLFALPLRVKQVMASYPGCWCIAGGWALSLAAGKPLREHSDIEVAVFRSDQRQLREHLSGWQPQYVNPAANHQLQHWLPSTPLELPVHEIHTKPPQADLPELEFLLNESDGGDWVYRRSSYIRLKLDEAILTSPDGVRYLAPQLVLLYKSKDPRPRDESDFAAMLPVLTRGQCKWLATALAVTHKDHPWTQRLQQKLY